MDLQKFYFKALRWAISNYPNAPVEHHRAFAASVAQLCNDNPHLELPIREQALQNLTKISGGPSVREHACLWAAYGRGDAIQTLDGQMTTFLVDERFKLPGTWDFDFACQFCSPIAFGVISELHRRVWHSEPNCFDDFEGDLIELNKGKKH